MYIMPTVIFSTDDYTVTIHYEEEEQGWLKDIVQFEATRILSLESRKIVPKTELREWDSIREISVKLR